ncbi:MAG: hypothetical protein FK733_00675 [Asgard group archaeon]|nr:hypothetical protein [Asgard group archaeon]
MYAIDEKKPKQKYWGIISINIGSFVILHELAIAILFIFVLNSRVFLLYYTGISAIPIVILSVIGIIISRREKTKMNQQIAGTIFTILALITTIIVVFGIYLIVLLLYMLYITTAF